MTHNRFSDFHCVYTIIQVVHTEFVKVVLTSFKQNYSGISCSSNIHGTNFREKQVKEMEKKEEPVGNLHLKEAKNYEILQAEMRLQHEYNYKILFANDFWKL